MKKKKIICLLLGLVLLVGSLGVSAARYMEKTEEEAPVQVEGEPLDVRAMLLEEILPDAILLVTEILESEDARFDFVGPGTLLSGRFFPCLGGFVTHPVPGLH